MDPLTTKSFTTSRHLTYTYYASQAPTASIYTDPALLFLHGFPDGPLVWRPMLPYLLTLPNRLIIPSLLGYSPTSTPTTPATYNSQDMSADLAELLAAENIDKVVAIGHDWGSFMATRLYVWQPTRVLGLCLLNVAYWPPSLEAPFDLNETNAAAEKAFGYPGFSYWELFTAGDGAAVLEGNAERFWEAMHGDREQPRWMREIFCAKGVLRGFLEKGDAKSESGGDGRLREYARERSAYKEDFFRRLKDKESGGIAPALCWYKVFAWNENFKVEKTLDVERLALQVPTLFVACRDDAVCRPEYNEMPMHAGLLPDLKVVEVAGCGHWGIMYERAEELAGIILGFLKERFA
ncbi:hypothetical protein PAAG_06941 [Paracoccidioides lutzii Pb01]|uniref:AB hydrolase-1 domain-containing protein n=1 Tax=Paracoccidioides lutzii (strain ATCC MYA-826 / Pb01) TaxID=502779 RepID=C1H8E5_PARBA|nr:hypothetical protein PAAG_06941 [Paracoccidioides lutzii Pb01]EEH36523.1 hypothetical protein PAAG_06941 [Paracoccidioides lutzii Pb01]